MKGIYHEMPHICDELCKVLLGNGFKMAHVIMDQQSGCDILHTQNWL